MFRKSRNIFGRTKFSAIIVCQKHKANHSVHPGDHTQIKRLHKTFGFYMASQKMPQRTEYHHDILYAVFPGASLATLDQIQRSRNIPPV